MCTPCAIHPGRDQPSQGCSQKIFIGRMQTRWHQSGGKKERAETKEREEAHTQDKKKGLAITPQGEGEELGRGWEPESA